MWMMVGIPFLTRMIKGTFNMKSITSGDEKLPSVLRMIVPILLSEQKAILQSFSCRAFFLWFCCVVFFFLLHLSHHWTGAT